MVSRLAGPVKLWANDREVGCNADADAPVVARAYEGDAIWKKGENAAAIALHTNGDDVRDVDVALPHA